MISKKCSMCEKVIEGYKESHVEYMMLQHIISRHKESIMVKDINDYK